MRHVVAYDIAARMEYGGQDLLSAVKGAVFERLAKDSGGVIAVDRMGNSALEFNTTGMYRASIDDGGNGSVGIWETTEHFVLSGK